MFLVFMIYLFFYITGIQHIFQPFKLYKGLKLWLIWFLALGECYFVSVVRVRKVVLKNTKIYNHNLKKMLERCVIITECNKLQILCFKLTKI